MAQLFSRESATDARNRVACSGSAPVGATFAAQLVDLNSGNVYCHGTKHALRASAVAKTQAGAGTDGGAKALREVPALPKPVEEDHRMLWGSGTYSHLDTSEVNNVVKGRGRRSRWE